MRRSIISKASNANHFVAFSRPYLLWNIASIHHRNNRNRRKQLPCYALIVDHLVIILCVAIEQHHWAHVDDLRQGWCVRSTSMEQSHRTNQSAKKVGTDLVRVYTSENILECIITWTLSHATIQWQNQFRHTKSLNDKVVFVGRKLELVPPLFIEAMLGRPVLNKCMQERLYSHKAAC
eukprot:SAG31_NODE_438_length_15693_cov_6.254248_3_plen_178_part_00